jgi:hypothetical protein
MRPYCREVAEWANLHTTLTPHSPVGTQRVETVGSLIRVSSLPTTYPERPHATEPGGREAAHATPLGATPAVGDEVHARDGALGRVAAVLRSETAIPHFIVVATGRLRRRYPVLACGLITEIDGRVVRVRGLRRELRDLPEDLPIVV